MAETQQQPDAFLARLYQAMKVLAAASVAVAGVVVSVIAARPEVNPFWQAPAGLSRFAVAAIALLALLVYAVTVVGFILLLRDTRAQVSFFRNLSKNLQESVAQLQGIAFNDPITGIGNSHALQREIARGHAAASVGRCLILLDLQHFGAINKKYNHWQGDEYLRRFADKVSATSRRDEYLFKKRPLRLAREGSDATQAPQELDAKAFRRNSGGDEFFVLINGTLVDGLGYLTRLQKRRGEFEQMSIELLGAPHPFGFHAGLVVLGKDENYESADKRVSECLGLAQDEHSPLRLYWNSKDMPELEPGSIGRRIVDDACVLFRKA